MFVLDGTVRTFPALGGRMFDTDFLVARNFSKTSCDGERGGELGGESVAVGDAGGWRGVREGREDGGDD